MSRLTTACILSGLCCYGLALAGLAENAVAPSTGYVLSQPSAESLVPDDRQRRWIEEAIPAKAYAVPKRARKLLVFDRNVGYGGHGSIRHANLAVTLMGNRTGAFETVHQSRSRRIRSGDPEAI